MLNITIGGKARKFDLEDPQLPHWIADEAFGSGLYPYDEKLKRSAYNSQLDALHLELVKLQAHQQKTGQRIIIIFEGRDAAGKGGTINAVRSYLNSRHARTVALTKPTETEQGQWYFQRYVDHFPTDGEMILFDRSWYNRAGVEPVMGFCTPQQHKHFLAQVPSFEKQITDEGIAFFKIWLNVGQEMQIKRFHDRRHNPLKSWKLSPLDIKAMQKWDDYTAARNLMLKKTHTPHAPWTIVRSNDKRRARINTMRHILRSLKYEGKDTRAIGRLDPQIIGQGPLFINKAGA
ncbi:polyphosphate kinase 2 [Pseudahrensia aquimaris]|uniref:ADP/GDP-polyphosphate phosphotransferase n=1 Tax=Pseudahrensia aquimaris TaxID=744461 RepID=A0ABW3FEZ1_9HYPH